MLRRAYKQLPMSRNKTEKGEPAAVADDVPTAELEELTEADIAAMEAQEQLEASTDRALQSEIEQLRCELKEAARRNAEMTALLSRRDEELAALKSAAAAKAPTEEMPPQLLQRGFEAGETRKLVGQGEHASYEFAIRPGHMSLGSAADNDIRVKDGFISAHHAQILSGSKETILRDMNSTNGTQVNSRRINKCALHDGDSITVGNVSFTFVRNKKPVADVHRAAQAPEAEHSARLG